MTDMILCCSSLMLFLIAKVMINSPAKHINNITGYRTKRSMLSQKNWDIAQVYSVKVMKDIFMKAATMSCFVILLDMVLIWKSENLFLISITVQTSIFIYLLYLVFDKTEEKLKIDGDK